MSFRSIFFAAVAVCICACSGNQIECSIPATVKNNVIVTETPARAQGQQNVLNLSCDPIDTVRVAFVGLGMRGSGAVARWTNLEGVKIVALCDAVQACVDNSQKTLAEAGLAPAREYVGEEAYKDMCKAEDIDLVYICTDWVHHVPVALEAMRGGKHAAIEVPSALSLKDCWDLVDMAEQTRLHCICLENCCYDFFEAACLNMARQGLFGEVIHAEGAYIHNLNPFWGEYSNNWRALYNQTHRGDNYPTHGFGPICQVLDIHRSDIMTTVVAMDTDAYNSLKAGKEYIDPNLQEFANGDHTITLVRTAKGKVMEIQHNVYAERPYSRMYQLTGTEGFANKYPYEGITIKSESFLPREQMDSLLQQYKPQYIKDIEEKAREVGGHGGMDFIMDYRVVASLRNGLPMDIDVYDLAEWCCVQELSRLSLENGSMPVQVPDFTRGDWNK